ncbi:hypothetical protein [Flavobacterium sp.]|uniref:hypothetical protein n=1 Tax=Flavobacterium sp. TaxID=239 RepID=UPI002FDB53DB
MKTKTKIEKLLFVVITAFLLFSCEKELYEDSIKKDYNGKTEILIGKEAEKVALRLKNILESRSTLDNGSLARTITLDIGTINYDEIVKIIDTYGKENYTFEIRYPIEDDKKFGNLILQEKDNYTTVKLIEYYMTDAFAQEYKLNYDLKQFQGNIKFIPIYTDNPCPDPELIVQIGNVPANCIGCGGGSNNNNNGNIPGGGTINPGGNNYSEPLIITITDGDTSQDSGEDNTDVPNWIIWNPPTFGKLSIDPITPTDPTTPEDPCPQTTEIGILYPVDKCSKTFLEHLDNTSRKWLYTHNEVHNDIMNYIKNSPNCDGANEFAKDAIDSFRNGGEVDFENKIIYDPTFMYTKTDCIHKKLKTNSNDFYYQMLSTFDNNTNYNLTFKVGNTPNGDWGITKGSSTTSNNYIITISQNIENGSNLMRTVTLCHELIHAYMLSTLESSGLITFDINGDPILNINCATGTNYNTINLNTLSISDRFVALLCALNQNGTLTQQWTHDLFNSANFDVNTYRQELENLIYNEYDWNNEDINFKNQAIIVFGSNWKHEIAKGVSWIGLENTQEYTTFINSYSTDIPKILYLTDIRNKISTANNNCL